MLRLVTIGYIVFGSLFTISNSDNKKTNAEQEREVSIVRNDGDATKPDTSANIHTPNDLSTMNPQLIAALKEINDDPSYLQPKEGELVDLSQFQMDPEKLEEMIEIFDWIESQLPPDDPQQIQNILNRVEQYITKSDALDANYTDDALLRDLTILPEFLYQVDNGVDFMKMNGAPILLRAYAAINTILAEDTNTTLTSLILSQIMNVIGVATQNNPNAIQYAHQANLVSFIVNELNNSVAIGMDGQLVNKLLFTLSSVTRQSETGLQHLQSMNGSAVLYKCGKLLSKEIDRGNHAGHNLQRAFKKLLTMVSDIVVLNGNNIEYSRMFLNSGTWCGFMIEKGFVFDPESVLQFVDYALQSNYCVEHKMLMSLHEKLNQIIQQNDNSGDEEYFDDVLFTQAGNMLTYIQNNFDYHKKKTEL